MPAKANLPAFPLSALLARALACLLFCLALPASAQSPEFWQLLNDINGQFKVLSPSLTRGPVCAGDMVRKAKEGLQSNLASTALNKVVVEPLEQGAKVGLGALGVPGLAISSYSMMRCALSAGSAADFGKCALGEVIGYAGGEALQKYGVDNLEGALAGWAWDKAYGEVKDAWDAYGQTSERVEWEAGGECKVTITAVWNKRRRPGAEGGTISLFIRADECKCPTGRSLKRGFLRVNVPVRYARAGSDQPGFSAGSLQNIRLEATCCGARRADENVYLYDASGRMTGIVRPDDTVEPTRPTTTRPRPQTGAQPQPPAPVTTPQTTPRPSRPAVSPKPKPKPKWPPSEAQLPSVCPECNQYRDAIQRLNAEIDRLSQQAREVDRALDEAGRAARDAEARIRRARAELNVQEGTGGSAFDPASGLTTEAVTQSDGRVRIRVTDAKGNVVEERFRERKDLAGARDRLAEGEKQLEKARADEARLRQEAARIRAQRANAQAALNTQQALYDECIEKCRRKVLFGEPPMGVAVTAPVEFSGGSGAPAVSTPTGAESAPPPKPTDKPEAGAPPPPPGATGGVTPSTAGAVVPDRRCPACDDTRLRNALDELARRERSLAQVQAAYNRMQERFKRIEKERYDPKGPSALDDDLDEAREKVWSRKEFVEYEWRRLQDCYKKNCPGVECVVEVERVVNVTGNNPFDSRDPLREGASAPLSCSTSLTPRTYSSCSPNSCGITTPFSLLVSGGAATLSPFNSSGPANGPVTFCNGTSVSSNLNILGAPGHQCSIVQSGSALLIQCKNNFGAGPGSCFTECF